MEHEIANEEPKKKRGHRGPQKGLHWTEASQEAADAFYDTMVASGEENARRVQIEKGGGWQRSDSKMIREALIIAARAVKSVERPAPLVPPTNDPPLMTLRGLAGLSQSEAAQRMKMSRGAYANAEKVAQPSAKMLARARVAFATGEEA